MSLFRTLFRQHLPRHYALLDDQDRCRMLLTAKKRPIGERWVEIAEIRLGWIGKPLPQAGLQQRSGPIPHA
ncbi:hypothetical protein CXF92_09340 [Pseudomonas sp. Choline-3u-10]|jgi:hypothetical protein|uniref:hypothetical protein n=1 Tax=Pseudomonadaceae TaxID=135621 RepID=UPI000617C443|nr:MULTISPECIES: hypothetical protein [Pseudomonadaceae]MAL36255.1 hypothetical protein [Pseudomonas sp.]MBU0947745.1 hypothetical protein [Gammaproteobacteria bacterium]KJJ63276.1 hypothetical protein RT21_11135 [Pseudomonas sp. 10B238]MBK3796296.1 hypothetical protein [Stutzerimonas stutzeri]MBK3876799.1 hypothetical protein [Stutzerimonas stutzeri]|tara:strand:- start:545 stop:757 length:213 start_codon:yes stop_codon:yes gene_type:complete